MHEQDTSKQEKTVQELVEIHNSPLSFRTLVEQAARKLGFQISKIEFDVVVSREVEEDGTEHITKKPFLLTEVEHIGDGDILPLLVLTKKGESTYAVRQKSWGGNIYGDGDQTIYYDISVVKLRKDTPLTAISPSGLLEPPSEGRIFYSHKRNWIAGANIDYVGSEEREATISYIGEDPLLNEVTSHLERKKQPSTA